jgi:hypothetical protein
MAGTLGTAALQPTSAFVSSTALTTKGDLLAYSTAIARLGVGSNGQVLSADSTQTTGLKWVAAGGSGTVTTVSVVTANGVSGSVANPTTAPALTLTVSPTAIGLYAGSFSQVGTATTTFTVTIGVTLAANTFKVNVTPTALLSAAAFYVTNKTTTTFDVVYLAGLTGTVTFDWILKT